MRLILAAVLAGAFGTLVNALVVAAIVSADKLSFALVPGRYGVAIALCLSLPLLCRALPKVWAYPLGAAIMTLGASALAKLGFLAPAPWSAVLGFNLVFALAATATYAAVVQGLRLPPQEDT